MRGECQARRIDRDSSIPLTMFKLLLIALLSVTNSEAGTVRTRSRLDELSFPTDFHLSPSVSTFSFVPDVRVAKHGENRVMVEEKKRMVGQFVDPKCADKCAPDDDSNQPCKAVTSPDDPDIFGRRQKLCTSQRWDIATSTHVHNCKVEANFINDYERVSSCVESFSAPHPGRNKKGDLMITVDPMTFHVKNIQAGSIMYHFTDANIEAFDNSHETFFAANVCQSAIYLTKDRDAGIDILNKNYRLHKIRVAADIPVVVIHDNHYPQQTEDKGVKSIRKLQAIPHSKVMLENFCRVAKQYNAQGWRNGRDQDEIFLCKDSIKDQLQVELTVKLTKGKLSDGAGFENGGGLNMECTGGKGTVSWNIGNEYNGLAYGERKVQPRVIATQSPDRVQFTADICAIPVRSHGYTCSVDIKPYVHV